MESRKTERGRFDENASEGRARARAKREANVGETVFDNAAGHIARMVRGAGYSAGTVAGVSAAVNLTVGQVHRLGYGPVETAFRLAAQGLGNQFVAAGIAVTLAVIYWKHIESQMSKRKYESGPKGRRIRGDKPRHNPDEPGLDL